MEGIRSCPLLFNDPDGRYDVARGGGGGRVAQGDVVHDVHPVAGHLAEDGVAGDTPLSAVLLRAVRVQMVQKCRLSEGDEELAAVGVQAARVGHREYARAIVAEVGMEFALEPVAGAPGPCAGGVSGLGHESLEHAVECNSVVESLAGEEDEVVDHAGNLAGIKLDFELLAFLQLEDGAVALRGVYDHFGRRVPRGAALWFGSGLRCGLRRWLSGLRLL